MEQSSVEPNLEQVIQALHNDYLKEARSFFERCVEESPECRDAWYYLGCTYAKLYEFDRTREVIEEMKAKNYTGVAYLQGLIRYQIVIWSNRMYKRLLPAALAYFTEASRESNPDNPSTNNWILETKLIMGKRILTDKIPESLDPIEAEIAKGRALRRIKNHKGAFEHYARLREQHPDSYDIAGCVLVTLIELHRYAQARSVGRQIVEKWPSSCWAWCHLGIATRRLGDRQSAVVPLIRAIELNEREPVPYVELMRLYLSIGNLRLFAKTYRKLYNLMELVIPEIESI